MSSRKSSLFVQMPRFFYPSIDMVTCQIVLALIGLR